MSLLLAIAVALSYDTARPPMTDSIWVYEHADDPSHDPYLRVWGVGGDAVPKAAGEANEYSFALLQWDVSRMTSGKKLKGAKLTLVSIPDPKYTEDQTRKFPLQAREVPSGFSEKTWKYDLISTFLPKPDPKAIFGAGSPSPFPKSGVEFRIEIDLMKGPNSFSEYLDAAEKSGRPLAIALTTALDVQINPDSQTIYKIYSRNTEKESVRPVLELTFE